MIIMNSGGKSRLRSMPMWRGKFAGFTLTEMLIAVVIVGILAAIAVPSYREFVAGQRIRTASFDLMAVLTLARSEAIKRGASAAAPVTVVAAGGEWANGWSLTAPDGTVLNQQSALTGLTVTCGSPAVAGACPANVAYAGNGRLTAAVPPFQIGSGASASVRCISIDLSGRPNAKTEVC